MPPTHQTARHTRRWRRTALRRRPHDEDDARRSLYLMLAAALGLVGLLIGAVLYSC